jgi:hypothetical protein
MSVALFVFGRRHEQQDFSITMTTPADPLALADLIASNVIQ